MKSFFKLVLFGAFLIIIDTIDAAEKERKKRVADCSNWSTKDNGQNGKMYLKYYEYMDDLLNESMHESEAEEYEFKRATNGEHENEGGTKSYSRTKRLTDNENIEEKQTHGNDGNDKENKVKKRIKDKYKYAEAIFDIIANNDLKGKKSTEEAQNSETVSKKQIEGTEAEPSRTPPTPTSVPPESTTEKYKVRYDPERKGPKTLKYTLYEDKVNGEVKHRLRIEPDGLLECEINPIIFDFYFGWMNEKTDKDATKDDTNKDATKDDTNKDATKDDTNQDATKDDINKDATNKDATKDDTNKDATKDDTNKDATKDDTNKDATKDDTNKDATKDDTNKDIPELPAEQDPKEIKRTACEPVDYSDLPRSFTFIVEDEKLNGKVKRTLSLEQDGIEYCQMSQLLRRYHRFGELH